MFTIYNQNTIQNVLTIVEFPLIPMKIQIFLFADDAISPLGQYIKTDIYVFLPLDIYSKFPLKFYNPTVEGPKM
jgi:hypothetical protein